MKLLYKLIYIFWPTSFIVVFFVSFLTIANEIYEFGSTIESQTEDVLYVIAFSDRNVEYKLHNLLNRNPELAIIGTSRVMSFRAEMFPDYVNYNAGGIVSNISHFRPLLEKLIDEGNAPEIIIIGLDQYFFNESWDKVRPTDSEMYRNSLQSSSKIVIPDRLRLIESLLNEPRVLISESILKSKNIGLLGKVYNQGFRVDGSYYYGRYYEFGINNDPDFSDTIYRIENGVRRFEYAEDYNPRSVEELEAFLLLAKQHEIFVVGFMPPYAPSINEFMALNGNYEYINQASIEISRLFIGLDYKYFDFTSMESTRDSQYIDGFHGDEKVYELIAVEINNILNKPIN
jgi:hypothetical protein